jgi:hypothetical protein
MKKNGRVTYSTTIINLQDGYEWSASRPCRFTLTETTSDAHWIWGWVGSTTGLDAMEKRIIFWLYRESNSNSSVAETISRHYTRYFAGNKT